VKISRELSCSCRLVRFEHVDSIRKQGKSPDDAAELALAKQAYPDLTTFEMWAKNASMKENTKNWNQMSLFKLLAGRQ
jgi:hypothetical protein